MSREVRNKYLNYLQAPPTQAQIVETFYSTFNSMADLHFTIYLLH